MTSNFLPALHGHVKIENTADTEKRITILWEVAITFLIIISITSHPAISPFIIDLD